MSINSFGIYHHAKQYLIVRFVTLCVCCILLSLAEIIFQYEKRRILG